MEMETIKFKNFNLPTDIPVPQQVENFLPVKNDFELLVRHYIFQLAQEEGCFLNFTRLVDFLISSEPFSKFDRSIIEKRLTLIVYFLSENMTLENWHDDAINQVRGNEQEAPRCPCEDDIEASGSSDSHLPNTDARTTVTEPGHSAGHAQEVVTDPAQRSTTEETSNFESKPDQWQLSESVQRYINASLNASVHGSSQSARVDRGQNPNLEQSDPILHTILAPCQTGGFTRGEMQAYSNATGMPPDQSHRFIQGSASGQVIGIIPAQTTGQVQLFSGQTIGLPETLESQREVPNFTSTSGQPEARLNSEFVRDQAIEFVPDLVQGQVLERTLQGQRMGIILQPVHGIVIDQATGSALTTIGQGQNTGFTPDHVGHTPVEYAPGHFSYVQRYSGGSQRIPLRQTIQFTQRPVTGQTLGSTHGATSGQCILTPGLPVSQGHITRQQITNQLPSTVQAVRYTQGTPTSHAIVFPPGPLVEQQLAFTHSPQIGLSVGYPQGTPMDQQHGIPTRQQLAFTQGHPMEQQVTFTQRPPAGQSMGFPQGSSTEQQATVTQGPQTGQAMGFQQGSSTEQQATVTQGPQTGQAMGFQQGSSTEQQATVTQGPQTGQAMGFSQSSQTGQAMGFPQCPQTGQAMGFPQGSSTEQQATVTQGLQTGQAMGFSQSSQTGQAMGFSQSSQTGQAMGFPQSPPTGQAMGFPQGSSTEQQATVTQGLQTGQAMGFPQIPQTGQAMGFPQGPQTGQAMGFPQGHQTGQAMEFPQGPQTGQAMGFPPVTQTGQAMSFPQGPQTGQSMGFSQRPQTGQSIGFPQGPQTGQSMGFPQATNPAGHSIPPSLEQQLDFTQVPSTEHTMGFLDGPLMEQQLAFTQELPLGFTQEVITEESLTGAPITTDQQLTQGPAGGETIEFPQRMTIGQPLVFGQAVNFSPVLLQTSEFVPISGHATEFVLMSTDGQHLGFPHGHQTNYSPVTRHPIKFIPTTSVGETPRSGEERTSAGHPSEMPEFGPVPTHERAQSQYTKFDVPKDHNPYRQMELEAEKAAEDSYAEECVHEFLNIDADRPFDESKVHRQ